MAPLKGLTFTGVGTYDLDRYPETDPRYGECTRHMLASGDWTWGAQPTNRDGTVNYNDPLAGGASILGVNEDKGTGPFATYNSWQFSSDFSIKSWPAGPNQVMFLIAQGTANPPYAPGTNQSLSFGFTRAGFFFTQSQIVDHEESTGLTYHGGTIGVHLEVAPKAPWYAQVTVDGVLARTYCGNRWEGGNLFGASWGCMSVAGGSSPSCVLTNRTVSGAAGNRAGPAECPHGPLPGRRAWALWWPE